ncbi:hypothetical protein Gotri_015345 [Gossypium trilobum]|uniref:Uncharacterized protein n=1 Tax=Gossypium trilobum TaxID=34281 RepID=A0A7J9DZW1_9ROSI|nr:hypothetical protein [Gossypium trilobum]
MWTSNGNGLRLTQSMVEEEDINLLNGDVLTEVVDGLPLIQFLERVHALMHKSMNKTIVIKLLDNGTRGKFARMVVYVYLRLPLISKIKIGNDVHVRI